LLEALNSGKWGSCHGDKVNQFQKKFARYMDAKFGLCLTNGTHALELALKTAGITRGDEVIIPAYTFMATASAVLDVGAVPVLADIEPDTCNIDPEMIEAAITEKTRAIIPVHIGGRPADLDRIGEMAGKHGITIIEDACQAHGSQWKNRKVGAFGKAGVFSFQSSKNITCGEGGFLVTNDEEFYDCAWSLHNCGRVRGGQWYEHRDIGSNFRMTEFQAAILLAQFDRLPAQTKIRARNAALLDQLLGQIEGISLMRPDERITGNAYHIYIFRFEKKSFGGISRDIFIEALRAEGVPCSPGYTPLHKQLAETCSGYFVPQLPVVEKICFEEAVWIKQEGISANLNRNNL